MTSYSYWIKVRWLFLHFDKSTQKSDWHYHCLWSCEWRRRSFGFLGDVRSHSLSSFCYCFDIQTTTKLFIRHILHSCRDSYFPQYLVYKGKHLNYIEILGIVVRELTREQDSEEVECWWCLEFVIVDDGTGLLECRIRSKVLLQSESVENVCVFGASYHVSCLFSTSVFVL